MIDTSLTAWINGLAGRSHLLDLLMVAITQAGVPLLVAAVALQWWPRQGRESERHVLVACGLTFLLGLALNQGVLLLVHRVRPYDAGITHLLVARSADPSFPSDHATATFAIVLGFLLNARMGKAAVFLAGAMLVVLSRIFVGTHYVSDVLGGILTALMAAAFVRIAYVRGTRLDRWVTAVL